MHTHNCVESIRICVFHVRVSSDMHFEHRNVSKLRIYCVHVSFRHIRAADHVVMRHHDLASLKKEYVSLTRNTRPVMAAQWVQLFTQFLCQHLTSPASERMSKFE